MTLYVIAASPLTKAYLKEWHEPLERNPDLLFEADDKKTPFTFLVKRASGALRFEYNKPIHVASLLPKATDKELVVLFDWLTGGDNGMQCQETNVYGIVPYDPGFDPVKELSVLTSLEGFDSEDPKAMQAAQKKLMARQKEIAGRMAELKATARAKADARVLRHAKWTHNNLIKQWQDNEENKLGKYPPSTTEMFGMLMIEKDIESANARVAALKKRVSQSMANTQVV